MARLLAYATAALFTVGAGVAGAYAAGGMTADAAHADVTGRLLPLPRLGMQIVAMQHDAAVKAGELSPLDRFLQPAMLQGATPLRVADPATVVHDIECLTAAVYYEARGETREGQAAVAQVVLNRVRDAHFPKTVCGVVYQGLALHECQFTFACDGSVERRREPAAWARAHVVARDALGGATVPAVGGATHYHVADIGDTWGSQLVRVAQIGQHVFYRRGHHGGGESYAEASKGEPAEAPVELRGSLRIVADPVGAVLTPTGSDSTTPS
jgi:hypothetical protein